MEPQPQPRSLATVDGRAHRLGWIAILLLAAVLRLWAIDFGLPHLRARPDEYPIIEHTLYPARGELDVPWAIYPHAYFYASWMMGSFGLDVAQALGLAQEGDYVHAVQHDRATIILILRIFSALVGVLAVWLAMRLAGRIFGSTVALGAGLLVATNFLGVRESHSAKPDIYCTAAILFAFQYVVPLAREATPMRGLKAGLASAVAMACKYPGVVLAVPVYLAALMGSSAQGWRRVLPRPAIAALIGAAGLFIATNPYVVFGSASHAMWESVLPIMLPSIFPDDTVTLNRETEEGRRYGENLQSEGMSKVGEVVGYGKRSRWYGFTQQIRIGLRHGVGLLPTLLIPFTLLWALLYASDRARAFCWPAVAFLVAFFLLFGLSPAALSRYMTPAVPVLLILMAAFVADGMARLARSGGHAARTSLALYGVAILAIAGEGLAQSVHHDAIAARTDTRVLATRWLAENTAEGARIKDMGTVALPYGRPHVPKGRRPSRADPTPEALKLDGVSYVVTHEHVLFSSTVDLEAFARLEPYLELVAEFDPAENASRPAEDAYFEPDDAYYIPIKGMGAVTRAGPLVRIYAFRHPPDHAEGARP